MWRTKGKKQNKENKQTNKHRRKICVSGDVVWGLRTYLLPYLLLF